MNAAPAEARRVVVLALDEPIAAAVQSALGTVGIASTTWEPTSDGGTGRPLVPPSSTPAMLVLQAGGLDLVSLIRTARAQGWLGAAVPIVVVVPDAADREQRLAWLEAGAWEIVRLPLDEELFGLQARNFLLGSEAASRIDPAEEPYARAALVRVTEENLALARRYRRPLAVAAFSLDWGARRGDDEAIALMERLATTAHDAVRGSDLVGVTPRGTLLTLLPDTDPTGARVFTDRLTPRLESRLREWGVLARIISGRLVADTDGAGTAEEFLREAEASLD